MELGLYAGPGLRPELEGRSEHRRLRFVVARGGGGGVDDALRGRVGPALRVLPYLQLGELEVQLVVHGTVARLPLMAALVAPLAVLASSARLCGRLTRRYRWSRPARPVVGVKVSASESRWHGGGEAHGGVEAGFSTYMLVTLRANGGPFDASARPALLDLAPWSFGVEAGGAAT